VPVGKVLKAEADSLTVYDLGDNWRHDVVQEKILPADNSGTKPICLAGERRCPPEDVGGPSGYQEFLEVIFEPGHQQFERYGECGERILIGCAGPENTSGFQNLDLN